MAATADELQEELREGPCVDAAFEQENFVVHDLRSDGRWPAWAARVTELGVLSSFSIRLTAHEDHRRGPQPLRRPAREPSTVTRMSR